MILGFSHAVQVSVLLKSVGAGYVAGFIFCLIMSANAVSHKSAVRVFIKDIFFFVFAAFFLFLFLLKYNSGIFRFYICAGELMGFLIFYIFPGKSIRTLICKLYLHFENIRKHITLKLNEKKKSCKNKSAKKKHRCIPKRKIISQCFNKKFIKFFKNS